MKSRTIILALLIWWLTSSAVAQVSFIGNSRPVFDEVPAATTGLSHIYVLYDTQGVSMTYTASTDRTVVWYTFGEQGGGYAQERTDIVYDGRLSTLSQVEADCGYIIDEGTDRICVWVTDYSKGYLHLNGLSADNAAGDCGTATLNVAGSGEDLVYYTTGGVRHTLDRGMTLTYNTLEWNDTTQWREPVVIEENVASFKNTIVVPAPYCNTSFHLSRDRFLTFWKEGNDVWSDTYVTTAVNVHAQAVQDERYREFVTEGNRWFDLKRWHILVKTIKEKVPADDLKYKNISTRNYYLPVPLTQIELNPKLEQNWGYAGETSGDPYAALGWE